MFRSRSVDLANMAPTLAVMRTEMAEQTKNQSKTLARWMVPLLLVPGVTLASTTYDRAQVVRSVPVYETVSYEVPVEECRTERKTQHPC